MRALEQARDLVGQYHYELTAWQEEVAAIKAGKKPPEKKTPKPQKESIREALARLKKEAQEQPQRNRKKASRELER